MKIRDLKHTFEAFPPARSWPPVWMPGGWVSEGEFGEAGVLVSVTRLEGRLSLRYEGREHPGRLQWEPPPTLTSVEQILQANLGKAIQDLGELDV